jgi:hypothetical protein
MSLHGCTCAAAGVANDSTSSNVRMAGTDVRWNDFTGNSI